MKNSENNKTLLKDIEENLNKWKDIPRLYFERFNVIKMAILSKLIYRSNTVPIEIPVNFFAEIDKLILKFT